MRLSLFLTGAKDDLPRETAYSYTHGSFVIHTRRITKEDLLACIGDVEDRDGTVCYICGPAAMTDGFVSLVKDTPGMDDKRVFCEKWW
jgi:hypothetical protein